MSINNTPPKQADQNIAPNAKNISSPSIQNISRQNGLHKILQEAHSQQQQKTTKPQNQAAKKTAQISKNKPAGLFQRLALLYDDMHNAYSASATAAGLSCQGCTENCCKSYFKHHTFVEWAYLWRGIQSLPNANKAMILDKAQEYLKATDLALSMNTTPKMFCPLLDAQGLCSLYEYRLMICRLHGTRNIFYMPNGEQQVFSGCNPYIKLTSEQAEPANESEISLDRTELYQRLAALELEYRQRKNALSAKINLSIAEMLVLGPPK